MNDIIDCKAIFITITALNRTVPNKAVKANLITKLAQQAKARNLKLLKDRINKGFYNEGAPA